LVIPAWRNFKRGGSEGLMASVKQPGIKVGSARKPAGVLAGIRRVADTGERRRDILGAIGLLFIAGLFAWQAYVIFDKGRVVAQIDQVTKWEVHELGEQVSTIRQRVLQAVNSATVTAALIAPGDDARRNAAVVLKQWLPELISVEFYRADLNEVLTGNFAKFGYAKAAMLIQAHRQQAAAPLQSQLGANKKRVLVMALPALRDGAAVAYAYVQIPMESLLDTFKRQDLSGARVDLRQGDGRGDMLVDTVGSTAVTTAYVPGVEVPGSAFRIATAPVESPVLFSSKIWVMLLLAVLAAIPGLFLAYASFVGWERARALLPGRRRKADGFGAETSEPVLATKARGGGVVALPPGSAPAAADAVDHDAVDRSIFRAYDIRGVVGETLTKGVARLIGRAIGSEAKHRGLNEIVVARDGRLSGPDLVASLIEGLRHAGCDVIDIGAAPTPVLYFATFHLNTGSGVMLTGSHNPPEYNGFKIVLGGETLSEGAIQDLYARISESNFSTGTGGLQSMNLQHDYLDRISGDVQVERRLKVVVDCGNGIAGATAPTVLEAIGCEVVPLFCEVDGRFPNHHPDPSDPQNLQDLALTVKQIKADLGVAFDGDGDRLGVVTAEGESIYPDRLLMLFARDVLSRNPGAAIIYDVKCTGKLQPLILEAGGSPMMWRTGHSLIKAKMRETQAELAGEMSGHFFFKERWYGFDDGIYAAARLLEILAGDPAGRTPTEVFAELPKGVSTPELKIPMEEGEHYRFVQLFQQKAKFEGARITTIDGVRADWADGWGLVRASNTTPVLVLRFDADSDKALHRIQTAFRGQLLLLNPKLELPF
jgi:phosphomannomutase/phosphoglucomutase